MDIPMAEHTDHVAGLGGVPCQRFVAAAAEDGPFGGRERDGTDGVPVDGQPPDQLQAVPVLADQVLVDGPVDQAHEQPATLLENPRTHDRLSSCRQSEVGTLGTYSITLGQNWPESRFSSTRRLLSSLMVRKPSSLSSSRNWITRATWPSTFWISSRALENQCGAPTWSLHVAGGGGGGRRGALVYDGGHGHGRRWARNRTLVLSRKRKISDRRETLDPDVSSLRRNHNFHVSGDKMVVCACGSR